MGDCTLMLSKEGFIDETVKITQGINGAYWRNLVTAPLVPAGIVGMNGILFSEPDEQSRRFGIACFLTTAAAWSIDYWTGASREHQPSVVGVTLKPRE